MEKIWRQMGLSDEEYERICTLIGREPEHLELGMFGVMWSEHCSYKNSKRLLKKFPTTGPQVIQGPGENAGVVDIGDGLAVAFKVESHNHPSALEPFAGAATGVGGVVRDIFAMGARPIAVLGSLRFGDLEDQRVRFLLKEAVAGIAAYGKGISVPAAGGEVKFDAAYQGNPLVNAMCVGVVRQGAIAKGLALGVGNPVYLLGAKTDRDGVEGATFASEELETEKEQRSTVPRGNPELEKRLIAACLELVQHGLVVGMQDLGAAGLTSSTAETANRAGTGIELDVNLVPCAAPDITPYEIMLSETQERMLLIAPKGKETEVAAICNKWEIEATVVGKVTDTGNLRVVRGETVLADIPASALTADAPVYQRQGKKPAYVEEVQAYTGEDLTEPEDYNQVLLQLLAAPNIADKAWVFKQMEEPKLETTLVPPGSDAGVIKIPQSEKAIAITIDGNGRYCYLDPYQGGMAAVAEAARNLVCTGAKPLALTDGLNFGNPENPEVYWQVEQMIAGMSKACTTLGIPVVSGNVSGYNESRGKAIYPTPIVGMVGLLEDGVQNLTQGFKQVDDLVVLIGETYPELGGSEYLSTCHGIIAGKPPHVDLERELKVQQLCLAAQNAGILNSAHDCAEGGLLVTIVESCLTATPKPLGVEMELNEVFRPDYLLFSESQSRIVVSLSQANFPVLQGLAAEHNVPLQILGRVTESGLQVGSSSATKPYRTLINLDLDQLQTAWAKLDQVFQES